MSYLYVEDLLNKYQDVLNELFDELEALELASDDNYPFKNTKAVYDTNFNVAITNDDDRLTIEDLLDEAEQMESLFAELKNHYDWEDRTLIHESDWLEYATDMFDEVYYDINKTLEENPAMNEFVKVDYEAFAEALKQDSDEFEYCGDTFWSRSK
jgi:hypothetical protein